MLPLLLRFGNIEYVDRWRRKVVAALDSLKSKSRKRASLSDSAGDPFYNYNNERRNIMGVIVSLAAIGLEKEAFEIMKAFDLHTNQGSTNVGSPRKA